MALVKPGCRQGFAEVSAADAYAAPRYASRNGFPAENRGCLLKEMAVALGVNDRVGQIRHNGGVRSRLLNNVL